MKRGVVGQHRAAVEDVGADLAVLFGAWDHEGLDARDPAQIVHVARHRLVMDGTTGASEAAADGEAARNVLGDDEILDVGEHAGAFAQHVCRLARAPQGDEPLDAELLVAASHLAAVAGAGAAAGIASVEYDNRAAAPQQGQGRGKPGEARADHDHVGGLGHRRLGLRIV